MCLICEVNNSSDYQDFHEKVWKYKKKRITTVVAVTTPCLTCTLKRFILKSCLIISRCSKISDPKFFRQDINFLHLLCILFHPQTALFYFVMLAYITHISNDQTVDTFLCIYYNADNRNSWRDPANIQMFSQYTSIWKKFWCNKLLARKFHLRCSAVGHPENYFFLIERTEFRQAHILLKKSK